MPGGGGARKLLTAKYTLPGTHRVGNTRDLPGGMLAVGIDSHISLKSPPDEILFPKYDFF